MKPTKSVMAERAPADVPEDTPQRRLWRQLNYFPTPPWAARAGAELIREIDPQAVSVWEPACGEGHMAEPFKAYFPDVFASDIYDHGYGKVQDFLEPRGAAAYKWDWVATNPPFSQAVEFLEQGRRVARRGVALLCRLSFLESGTRHSLLYGDQPVTIVAPFTDRVSMQLGSWDPKANFATAYAWFIWRFDTPAGTEPILRPIKPGAKKRLTNPADVHRFACKGDAPLFGS